MTDLSQDERDLIELARGGDDPSMALRDRMRARVLARVAAGVGAGAAAGLAVEGTAGASTGAVKLAAAVTVGTAKATTGAGIGAAKMTAAAGAGVSTKVVVGLGLAAVLGGGGYWIQSDAATPEAAPMRATAPKLAPAPSATPSSRDFVVSPGDPVAPAEVASDAEPMGAATSQKSPAAVPRASAAPKTSAGLGSELGMLRDVQRKLQRGDADRALEMLDEHERKHGKGQLNEERMAARVFALCQAGRKAEARSAAQRFLAHAPSSPLAPRVARACRD